MTPTALIAEDEPLLAQALRAERGVMFGMIQKTNEKTAQKTPKNQ